MATNTLSYQVNVLLTYVIITIKNQKTSQFVIRLSERNSFVHKVMLNRSYYCRANQE